MTCKDCLHYDVCGRVTKTNVTPDEDLYHHIEKVCYSFMDKPKAVGDLVPVVRCKDCLHFDNTIQKGRYGHCKRYKRIFADYDYCSMAQECDTVRH